MVAVVFVAWVVIGTVVAVMIGRNKGRTAAGLVLGLLLGWAGVLIIALMPPTPEERVRRHMRDSLVAAEAARRQAGLAPRTVDQWELPERERPGGPGVMP